MGGFLQLWGYSLNNLRPVMAWMTAAVGHDMAGMPGMTDSGPMAPMTTMDAASMAAGAIMPGMATNAEVDALKTLRGDASDAYFLQLMIRHHEGGVPMMDYAATYADQPGGEEHGAEDGAGAGRRDRIDDRSCCSRPTGEQPLPVGLAPRGPGGVRARPRRPAVPSEDMGGMTGMTGMGTAAPTS